MRRYIRPGHDAQAWVSSGRWGPRRARVTECWAVIKAEDIYTGLLRDNAARARPGERGSAGLSFPGRSGPEWIKWELRPNAVWRFGRAFLRCPRCKGRVTRLYIPSETAHPACRRCWGLTYESRQQGNYKTSGGLPPILSPLAKSMTVLARLRQAEASAKRYAERREILRRE